MYTPHTHFRRCFGAELVSFTAKETEPETFQAKVLCTEMRLQWNDETFVKICEQLAMIPEFKTIVSFETKDEQAAKKYMKLTSKFRYEILSQKDPYGCGAIPSRRD